MISPMKKYNFICSLPCSCRRLIICTIVLSCMKNEMYGVDAVAAGRRRRRSTYYIRPCGPGQRAIWTPFKKSVSECVSCEDGKYRSDTEHGLEECNTCEGGRYSSPDKSYCIGDICRSGSFYSSSTSSSGAQGSGGCLPCPVGKYSGNDGMFACNDCESGRFSSTVGSRDCNGEMCPAGKWGAAGSVSRENSGICTSCISGKFSLIGSHECNVCPVGKYSIDDGASSCVEHAKCPAAYYLDAMPKSDSSKISCTRCIYMSNFYYAGFVFALVVIGLNMLFFVSHCSSSYTVIGVCLSICPTCWILFLNFCRNKRNGNGWVIASFVMNTLCLYPLYIAVKKSFIVFLEERRKKRQELAASRPQQLPVTNGTVKISCAV